MLDRRDFIRRIVGGCVGVALAPSPLLSTADTYLPSAGTYCPLFYANEGLRLLHKTLALSRHIHRTYDDRFQIGDTITIRLPVRFRESS
jgi:hypothetical protein